ncbi:MAG: hypothetical protein RL616_1770 [Verrucomicrobiota bacterium]|jgi:hypothetical protein
MTSQPQTNAVGLPKIIWILWLQGFELAPELVRKCVHSWRHHNPDWKIILLDGKNLADHLDLDAITGPNRPTISPQHLSDIIRINLLAKYGGVWADAACFCCQPLDIWLKPAIASGFFAFANPGPDRLLASWFLGAEINNHLVQQHCRSVNQYWRTNHFDRQNTKLGRWLVRWLGKWLNTRPERAALWLHPRFISGLRLHPYFWFHYIFQQVVTTDSRSGEIWRLTPKISAEWPHQLKRFGLLKPATIEIKAIIAEKREPLYKLNWRNGKAAAPDSVLAWLLNSI